MDEHKTLKALNIVPSVQRVKILKFLNNEKRHFTVDDLYNEMKREIPNLSRTTIYNTVELFTERGLLKKLNSKYNSRIFDNNLLPHGHFICEKCHRVMDVNITDMKYDFLEDVIINEQEITLSGVCSKCK